MIARALKDDLKSLRQVRTLQYTVGMLHQYNISHPPATDDWRALQRTESPEKQSVLSIFLGDVHS